MRPLLFGEVLFDRFPDGSEVLGGAPFNVAWNLRGLGFDPLLISAVGDDPPGRKVRQAMETWEMDRAGIQVRGSRATGTVDVGLVDGEPSFDIVAGSAWDAIRKDRLPGTEKIGLLYHGTLALREHRSREALEELLRLTDAPVLVDVNLRPPWWDRERVLARLRGARLVKMNQAELEALAPPGGSLERRATDLMERYGLELLCVTRGSEGAVAFTPEGPVRGDPPGKNLPVRDTVGAGDAFASVLIAGQLEGWRLETTLSRAQALASGVVGLRGAVTPELGFYRRFREEWRLS